MDRPTKVWAAGLAVIGLIAAWVAMLSGATRYCPLMHHFDLSYDCVRADDTGSRVLVKHTNVSDKVETSWSVIDKQSSHEMWIADPPRKYHTVFLDRANPSMLVVDGERVPMQPLPK